MLGFGSPIRSNGPMMGGGGAGSPGGAPGHGVGGPDHSVGAFKHGGKVKKTGFARVHEGERVLTKKQQKHDLKSSAKHEMKGHKK